MLRRPKIYAYTDDPGVGKNGIRTALQLLATETLRMRYFFHISSDGTRFDDETGTVLPDVETARHHASVIAAELAQDGDAYHGFEVYAVDEGGNEIARLPVVVPS